MDKYDADCYLIEHFHILISMTILEVIVSVSFLGNILLLFISCKGYRYCWDVSTS